MDRIRCPLCAAQVLPMIDRRCPNCMAVMPEELCAPLIPCPAEGDSQATAEQRAEPHAAVPVASGAGQVLVRYFGTILLLAAGLLVVTLTTSNSPWVQRSSLLATLMLLVTVFLIAVLSFSFLLCMIGLAIRH